MEERKENGHLNKNTTNSRYKVFEPVYFEVIHGLLYAVYIDILADEPTENCNYTRSDAIPSFCY